jgi:hypothetical protein
MVRKVLFHMVGNNEAELPQDMVWPDSLAIRDACAELPVIRKLR